MGHTGSVQRGPHGALYGERLGSHPAGAVNRANYTPAQLQALYLSRGRPDMGFMSNQAMLPKDVPEMQQTSTVKNHVNLKKSSLKLVPIESPSSSAKPNLVSLEFQFDATKPCRVTVFLVALEEIDDDTGCSRYSHQHKNAPSLACDFPEGLSQKFSLIDHVVLSSPAETDVNSVEELFDLSCFSESELIYEEDSLKFPLIIVLEVLEPSDGDDDGPSNKSPAPQSQSTFCTFAKQPSTGGSSVWTIKMLKQKIQVDGLTYELQEIYGIDGSLAAAPKNDASSGDGATGEKKGGALDEIDMPDGAECIICMCEPRNTTVLPCRHMCLCSECAEALRKSSSTCPICRTRVEGLLQIRVDARNQSDSKD